MDVKSGSLPGEMWMVCALVDTFNDNNYYIFGSDYNNQCWYFNQKKESFIKIDDIPRHIGQNEVSDHGCAMFETPQNKNKYALIYGANLGRAGETATYAIYDFKINAWNENAIKLNNLWFNDEKIMKNGQSKYGFGQGLSMVTDLFQKNKIHIIGGASSLQKYGYFEFNEDIINNSDLSQFVSPYFEFFFCFSVICANLRVFAFFFAKLRVFFLAFCDRIHK